MADPTSPFRSGAAGVILPPGAHDGETQVIDRTRSTGPEPRAVDHNGFHRLLRNLRTGEAGRVADRLRRG